MESNKKKTKGIWRKTAALCSIAALTVGLLAACSTKTETESSPGATTPAATTPAGKSETSTAPTAAAPAPLDLSVMSIYYGAEPPKQDNRIIQGYEKLMNVKFKITWVPSAAYADKLNITIASNSMPKSLLATDLKAPVIVNSARSGAFWEIGPLLKDYPNLSKVNPIVLNNSSIDGKIYGLYRTRPLSRDGVIFRKDWLDNVGLKAPATIDELYNVIKAFTLNDPDKNGKNDTVGLYLGKGDNAANDLTFNVVSSWFGSPNKWEAKDNKLSPDFITKEYLDTMKFYQKLYKDKLINQDFALTNKNQIFENVNKGKAGMYIGTMSDAGGKHTDLVKLFPTAVMDVQNRITGPKGDRVPAAAGFFGAYLFPKSSVKTEAELKQILAAYDQMASPDGVNMEFYGIKGTDYDLDNGKVKKIISDKDWVAVKTDVWSLDVYFVNPTEANLNGTETPLGLKLGSLIPDNEKIVVGNPAEPFISDTFSQKGSSLDKIIYDARTKFIMGESDENGWKQAIAQWTKEGGDKVIEEMSAAYAKTK